MATIKLLSKASQPAKAAVMATTVDNLARSNSVRPVYMAHALTPNQNALIVFLHFFAMYLELSVYSGKSLIFPYAASTFIALIGGMLNRTAVKSTHLSFIFSIIAFVALSSFIPFLQGSIILSEFVRSFLQLSTAIVSAYCIFIVIILSSRRRMVQLLFGILGFVIAGSFLERFSAVKAFSDGFRSFLYPKELLYSADYRDIATYGSIRPRFLTREPSIVGIGAGLLIAMTFLLLKARLAWKVAAAFGTTLVCIWVMRSPTIIFFAGIVFYGAVALRPSMASRFSWVLAVASTIALIAVSFLLAYGSGISGISTQSILGGGSYVIRVFGPPLIWLETLRTNALFGLGLGSFDALLPIARKVYSEFDILALFPYLKSERDGAFLISNGFWEYWIFFGLLGGSLIIALLYQLFRAFGLRQASFPFYASVLALQTYGGISAYRPWHMIFVFAAIAFIVQKNADQPDSSA
jgi:hypothetical protein